MLSKNLAEKVGKRKVKDIQNILDKLCREKVIHRTKKNKNIQWTLVESTEEVNDDGQQTSRCGYGQR